MQPFATLLRDKEVGVGYLTLDDLTSGLLTGGYDQILPMDQVAPWLRSAENRSVLSQEVALLLERVAKDAKSGAREKARRCALVLTTDDALAPAAVLRESSTATRDVFANVAPAEYWATNNNPPDLLDLVSQFSVRDAISLLRSAGQEKLELCNLSDSGWIVRVVGWFAANRAFVAADPDVQSAIRALSIWPSGEGLCSLDRLSVPGDFEDGLKLARILDPHISSRWASFLLEDLGARKLDLETYLIEHAPRAFEKEPLPDLDTRRALLRVLVAHAGDLLDEQNIATALRQLPIVECQDGQFHRPIGTYFENSLVLEVLGSTAPLAKLPDEKQMATRDVLQWLGVSDFPRAHDVLQRVENLTNQGPSADRREAIRSLFKGLAENWENLADKHDDLEELQRMAWLPGHRSTSWLPPSSVYSVFSRFLFETQAEFLDIPVLVQRVAADGLLRFLQIRSEPDVILVVKHLLQVAQHGDGVNMQVYEFLNRHALDQKINLLKGKACLYLSDGSYVEGGVCYWGTHPFGQNRIHLNQDWRKYQPLLTQLGVSESPTALDALQVLGEISEAYTDNRQLENEDHQVVMSCWSLLSEKLDDIPDLAESLASLKVVPNASHYLRKPCDVFFDDRPGLADKFDEAFRKLVIRRPETSWRAMATAGVRFLSSAVKMELVQCSDPILDEAMGQRLQERWPLVRRVFATLVDMPEGLTVPPELWGSDRLTVNYRILNYPGPTEDVVAHLTEARLRMYFCRGRMNVWGAIARELAFGFYPDVAAGPLAAAIKEVLQSADVEEARAGLDDLGIPEVALDSIDEPVSEDAGLGMGAGHNAGMGEESSGFDASTCESNAKADEEDFNDSSDESETGTADETGGAKPKWVRERGERGAGTQHGNGEGGKPKDRGHKPASVKTLREGYTFVGRSYLKPECENEDTELSEEAKARRADSDRQGIDKVLKSELQDGRQPTEMPHDNEGYDIESRAPEGQIVRYIEVKSLTGPWNGFGVKLSAPQFRMAQAKQDAYWLYVVEKATSADANIYRIQNPASKVVEYRFDDGWQLVAEEESTHQRRSILDVLSRNPASGDEMDEEIVGEKTPLLEDD
ncbi:DUF3883 domain-containing protein [Aquitalea palustris]|uniref:DUF3883 domain-containing protein n=2 Tax=Aquitalea palustris TaxID=2480983 RepID=A0A454JL94_9NEIS|nr:DUF3883 domain-containing protein [Aquitalea palustris]